MWLRREQEISPHTRHVKSTLVLWMFDKWFFRAPVDEYTLSQTSQTLWLLSWISQAYLSAKTAKHVLHVTAVVSGFFIFDIVPPHTCTTVQFLWWNWCIWEFGSLLGPSSTASDTVPSFSHWIWEDDAVFKSSCSRENLVANFTRFLTSLVNFTSSLRYRATTNLHQQWISSEGISILWNFEIRQVHRPQHLVLLLNFLIEFERKMRVLFNWTNETVNFRIGYLTASSFLHIDNLFFWELFVQFPDQKDLPIAGVRACIKKLIHLKTVHLDLQVFAVRGDSFGRVIGLATVNLQRWIILIFFVGHFHEFLDNSRILFVSLLVFVHYDFASWNWIENFQMLAQLTTKLFYYLLFRRSDIQPHQIAWFHKADTSGKFQ